MRTPARIAVLCGLLSANVAGHLVCVPAVAAQAGVGTLSVDLAALLDSPDSVRAIVRGDSRSIRDAAADAGVSILKVLDGFVVVEAVPAELDALRAHAGVTSISRDRLVTSTSSLAEMVMAAEQARAGATGQDEAAARPVSGRGIGVAVLDSGIAAHAALAGTVRASVNFATGESTTDDRFGHGTHIAGIIAGQANGRDPATGVAPDAHLISVRVLGRQGTGYASDVIAGLQWVIANRERHGIRIVNLSLGHPVVESCSTDPLCLEAERAVANGLVVVASAGNAGADPRDRLVLGSVWSPGNAPGVITVGALDTGDTLSKSDDTVASYSSRGPTRFDLAVKPDVVAPGTQIVSLRAAGSYLDAKHPAPGRPAFVAMSGTSVAAAMVSGGAALLLESAPAMAPRHVKVALQLTATPMVDEGLMSAGTGSVNLVAARRLSAAVLRSFYNGLPTSTIGGQFVRSSGLSYVDAGARLERAIGAAGLRVQGLLEVQRTGDRISHPGGQQIIWGHHVFNPSGSEILWGNDVFSPSGERVSWATDAPQ